jgi:hypothetical protein
LAFTVQFHWPYDISQLVLGWLLLRPPLGLTRARPLGLAHVLLGRQFGRLLGGGRVRSHELGLKLRPLPRQKENTALIVGERGHSA